MITRIRCILPTVWGVLALSLICPQSTWGGKPSQSAPAGEIYYEQGVVGPLAVMNADGSDKRLLPANIPGKAKPSYFRYHGFRWFLVATPMEDKVLPDGSNPTLLDAVREDGAVTLTLLDDPSLWFAWDVNWSKDDSMISLVAVTWDLSTEPPELVGSTLYALSVGFDEVGPMVLSPPEPVAVDTETLTSGTLQRPVYNRHDWAPDNSAIAYTRYTDGVSDIFILDLSTGLSSLAALVAETPSWSPDGTKICFRSYAHYRKGFRSLIQTIEADDSTEATRTTIVESTISVFAPKWSPTGEHIVYVLTGESRPGTWAQDVYIVGADGRGETNLTGDIPDSVWYPNWR